MQKFTLMLLSLVLLAPLGIYLYLSTLPDIAIVLNIPVSLVQTTIPIFYWFRSPHLNNLDRHAWRKRAHQLIADRAGRFRHPIDFHLFTPQLHLRTDTGLRARG